MRFLYNLTIIIIIIISPVIIIFRIFNGKENLKSFQEKFGFSKKKRNKGKLLWFHCSSVGEFLSIVPLIEMLEKQKNVKNILVSTSTLSSSKIFNKYKFKKTFHQFYPIDNPLIVNNFLNHWKPSMVFFIESEIWPEMIKSLGSRKIKILLLNARISKKSFKRWWYLKKFGINIFKNFHYIFPQNKETMNYLKHFGVKNLKFLGNLKFSEARKIKNCVNLSKNFNSRKILCAASTHENEEEIISNIHQKLKNNLTNLLTILIPRHVERTKDITETLKNKNLNFILHSEGKKLSKDTDVYLVDSYGQNTAFYAISKVVFLGGSFVFKGGQNPLEAIRYGCNVVHGKHVFNFTEIYNMLLKKKLSFEARSYNQLKKLILTLMVKNSKNKNKIKSFKNIGNNILNKHFKEIKDLI